jgi:hypothetical protein
MKRSLEGLEGALRLEALIVGVREFRELSVYAEERRTPFHCNAVLKKVLLNHRFLLPDPPPSGRPTA